MAIAPDVWGKEENHLPLQKHKGSTSGGCFGGGIHEKTFSKNGNVLSGARITARDGVKRPESDTMGQIKNAWTGCTAQRRAKNQETEKNVTVQKCNEKTWSQKTNGQRSNWGGKRKLGLNWDKSKAKSTSKTGLEIVVTANARVEVGGIKIKQEKADRSKTKKKQKKKKVKSLKRESGARRNSRGSPKTPKPSGEKGLKVYASLNGIDACHGTARKNTQRGWACFYIRRQ